MIITLVRHGQTENNFLKKLEGIGNSMMNDTGRRQCQRLKNKIRDNFYDYCYMSPSIRCVETAIILVGDRVETIPDERLNERALGYYEGRNVEEYNAYKYWNYDLNRNDLDVEDIHSVFERCNDFLNYIMKKYDKDSHIMIVTHSAPYRALRYLLKKNKLEGYLLDGVIDNCQIEEFKI